MIIGVKGAKTAFGLSTSMRAPSPRRPDTGGCPSHQGYAKIGLVHGNHFFLCDELRLVKVG